MADTLIRESIAYGSQPNSPVPQYWNGTSYEKVQGSSGAARNINYNSSGSEIFTGTTPGSVKLTATSTVVVSGTSTVSFSGTNTVEVVTSAGGTAYFSKNNPGEIRSVSFTNVETQYTATITWTAGTTATSSQTLNIPAITAISTSTNNELLATNDGPYAISVDVYKLISANSTTYTTSSILQSVIPATTTSAGVTYNATRGIITGGYNINKGLVIRLTATAAFTATVTNNIIINDFA